jgi:hypothetical protein
MSLRGARVSQVSNSAFRLKLAMMADASLPARRVAHSGTDIVRDCGSSRHRSRIVRIASHGSAQNHPHSACSTAVFECSRTSDIDLACRYCGRGRYGPV